MQFCHYIKHCRKEFNLTQEELVTHLYHYDDIFEGLDAVTLSRWERCLTTPNIERQQKFIQAMRAFCDDSFPCWDILDFASIEEQMYQKGIQKIIGKHKRFILNFPSELIDKDNLNFTLVDDTPLYQPHIELTRNFITKFTNSYIDINPTQFYKLATYESSFFLVATYQQQFFGVIFSIRIQKETFDKLLSKQITENDISLENLASEDEIGYEYPFTFFAYTEQCATILALRYYIHLLQNQNHIKTLGSLPKSKEGKSLVEKLGLKEQTPDDIYPKVFEASISDVLINPYILKMLFSR